MSGVPSIYTRSKAPSLLIIHVPPPGPNRQLVRDVLKTASSTSFKAFMPVRFSFLFCSFRGFHWTLLTRRGLTAKVREPVWRVCQSGNGLVSPPFRNGHNNHRVCFGPWV